MTRREEIVDKVRDALNQISVANGYHTDFDRLTYWQDTDSEYQKNHLDFRDTTEDYRPTNTKSDAVLDLSLVAVVIETDKPAPELGTLALVDLIGAVKSMSLCRAFFVLGRSHKYVETRGKIACHVELEVKVKYQF